jgi:hypothetical protein
MASYPKIKWGELEKGWILNDIIKKCLELFLTLRRYVW